LLAEATRAAAKALGLGLFAACSPSSAVTGINAPQGTDSALIVKELRTRLEAIVSNVQGSMRGHIFRLAHLGYFYELDRLAVDAATKRGIVVMNTPGGNAVSVAEHTLALILALARRLPQADSLLKQGAWEKKKLLGVELRSKTLGLIGLGKIGIEVARLAQAFAMDVLAYDPYVSSVLASEQNVKLAPLDEVLKKSDFVSLHASLTPETHHLVNTRTLALTKPGVRIINCARGELIHEGDLLRALESRHVAGAGLDVFET